VVEKPPPKGMKLLDLFLAVVVQGAHSYPPASCRNTLPATCGVSEQVKDSGLHPRAAFDRVSTHRPAHRLGGREVHPASPALPGAHLRFDLLLLHCCS
jgi:hypothetical protein